MRTFNELDMDEQDKARDLCVLEIIDLVRHHVITFADQELEGKIEQLLPANSLTNDDDLWDVRNALLSNSDVMLKLNEMALTMAEEAEYPSKNSEGLYKKVIQL